MMVGDLHALLREIPAPDADVVGGLTFSALPIPGLESHRLARQANGEPALLISAGLRTEHVDRPPPIQLEHISVHHQVVCRVRSPDGQSETAPFTVIQLSGADSHLRSYFLQVSWSLLTSLGENPTAQELHSAVHGLVELFRAITRPGRESVQGLWAEIFVLASAADPAPLVEAWHVTPDDRYDFHGGIDRIEVKSTRGRTRRHRFSLEQLQPPEGTRLLIASVMLEQSAGGVSLREALDRLRLRLQSHLALLGSIDRVVADTLGEALPRALEMRFDWELARDTLAFFPYEWVPSLTGPFPPQLSEISFVADLSGLDRADPATWNGGLFDAVWPL